MNLRVCAVSLLLAVTTVPASFLAAQQSIKCESNNGKRNYCGRYAPNQIRFDRQISGSPCVQGQSWGVDNGGLWVDRGCRAYFSVRGGPGYGEGYPPPPPGHGYPGGGHHGEGGWYHPGPNDRWPPEDNWNGGNWGSGGACFYQDADYRGDYFCLRRGENRDQLGGMGDRISSIRTFGGARVTLYDDRNYTGARTHIDRYAPDLHAIPVPQKPGHTWNDRISSVRVH
jgi:hypothetical protein